MEKLLNILNKLADKGLRGDMDESRKELALRDDVYQKDSADEKNLEQRYMELNLPREQRILVNDYIACVKTAGSRYSNISYAAGVKDTVKMLVQLGLLKE
jgi:hypothetical protein